MRIGVYIDVNNLALGGGRHMRYEILREFACRDGGHAARLNAYVSYDPKRAETDLEYRIGQFRFHSALRDLGYKIVQKEVKWYENENGESVSKANADVDLAVDVLQQSENLDTVVLVTGDGDFVQVVRALQSKGRRVEVIAFDNVSADLRREADLYISGYLVPGLLPIIRNSIPQKWGGLDGFARGVFYAHDSVKCFGWLRYLGSANAPFLWRTDAREEGSPYQTVFCHDSQLPPQVDTSKLPNRNIIFEFQIVEGADAEKQKAVNIQIIKART